MANNLILLHGSTVWLTTALAAAPVLRGALLCPLPRGPALRAAGLCDVRAREQTLWRPHVLRAAMLSPPQCTLAGPPRLGGPRR
eukprot:1542667-Pyramimonas_sp.AAC.1